MKIAVRDRPRKVASVHPATQVAAQALRCAQSLWAASGVRGRRQKRRRKEELDARHGSGDGLTHVFDMASRRE